MQNMALGRYRLREQVGAGGMADVWLATDETTGASVAVKRLHPQLAADRAMVERFAREAEAAGTIHHPNVVRVLDAGPSDLVLEYVEGESLAERLRRGPLEADLAARVAAGLASALAAVHAAGFVHGDVTPGNVILDTDGVPHLSDFGIARPILPAGTVASGGTLMGTRPYVAPEVMAGAPASPASDVWSLGATLREALTGSPPGDVQSRARKGLRAAQRPAAAIELGALAPLLPQMLDPEPALRPSAIVVARTLSPSPEAVTEVLLAMPAAGSASSGTATAVAQLPPTLSPPSPRRRLVAPARKVGVAVAGLLMASGLALAAAAPVEPAAGSQALVAPSPSPATATPTPTASTKPAAPPAPRPHARAKGHGGGHHGRGGQEGD